jgi:hypothetical protein
VSSAPDPESDSPDQQKTSGAKRGGRGKAASAPPRPESAEEAAKVFEEQLPESGGAVDASSLPTEAGGADESATPTATS